MKIIRFLIYSLVALSMLGTVHFAFGAETTKTLTFEWDQTDTTNLKEWRLYWSDVSGGPYDEQEVAVFAFDPFDPAQPGPTYSSPAQATVTGDQGTTVTKYFVLVACGDIPIEGGTTEYQCSDNSNEASYGFWIPAGKFSVPVQFRIQANP